MDSNHQLVSQLTTNTNNEKRMIEIDTTDLVFPTKPTIARNTNSPISDEDDDDSSTATETESDDSSLGGNSSDGSDEWQSSILATKKSTTETQTSTTTTTLLPSSNNETSKKTRVSFGNLEFRKYGMILGDHPDCLTGPPVTLSWEYQPELVIVPVEIWEECRPPRRQGETLALSSRRRQYILRLNGTTLEEMKTAIADVKRIQKQRRSSYRRCHGVVERFTAAAGPHGGCFWLSALLFGILHSDSEDENNNKNSLLVVPEGSSTCTPTNF